ncbi:HDOD domain-containing protein [Rhodocyclus tenuis]|uniref:EAL and HDOD domain-containing protein n=1 Tax=Rhodocyclus gracilis TaxID=2929842 RepID=UPI001298A2A9|nr:HDOD domain-containing protein [Rhodocyclus gracilis]MRD72180.1 HDOD domain-containing protein [Rhodocyclus gracilis]
MPDVLITRQPLIDRQHRIVALRLCLHPGAEGTSEAVRMLTALTGNLPQGERPLLVACPNADARLLEWDIPDNVALEFPGAAFSDGRASALTAALSRRQPALCLVHGGSPADNTQLFAPIQYHAFNAGELTPDELSAQVRALPHGSTPLVMEVADEAQFKSALNAGATAAASWFFTSPSIAPTRDLSPDQAHIIRVLNLVRSNADIREIETALKQDVTLTYRLLRHMNSASFGLSCEIQSFRHAVSILGYEKLNKWLSLLLASASHSHAAQALTHTSLTRARLMELLAHGRVEPQEYDSLFITGAFSLLDALLGVSMGKALAAMHLPTPIGDALLGRGGAYAPFLALALACEGNDRPTLAARAEALGISADRLNRAQLAALCFADAMDF